MINHLRNCQTYLSDNACRTLNGILSKLQKQEELFLNVFKEDDCLLHDLTVPVEKEIKRYDQTGTGTFEYVLRL